MKKKNIEILFEAFEIMAKRMKTPLRDENVGKYMVHIFKKFPQIKRTKILEKQLQEMMKEYILLRQIDDIEKTPKKSIERESFSLTPPQEQKISSPPKSSQEHVHFLQHPIQRIIAAFGVLGLGLLLAIPLMQNQIATPQVSYREAFDQMKSTFKWEGPKIPSLDEALNTPRYTFVIEGEIPTVAPEYQFQNLKTLSEIQSAIIAGISHTGDSVLYQEISRRFFSPLYPIIFRPIGLVYQSRNHSDTGPFVVFEVSGKTELREDVKFEYELSLLR